MNGIWLDGVGSEVSDVSFSRDGVQVVLTITKEGCPTALRVSGGRELRLRDSRCGLKRVGQRMTFVFPWEVDDG